MAKGAHLAAFLSCKPLLAGTWTAFRNISQDFFNPHRHIRPNRPLEACEVTKELLLCLFLYDGGLPVSYD